MLTALKRSIEMAYSFQSISCISSTPVQRYISRSTGRSTGSRNVYSRENTRAMNTPTGLVMTSRRMKYSAIWNQPFAVMLEPLRPKQSCEQVDAGQYADRQKNDVAEHWTLPYFSFSQAQT